MRVHSPRPEANHRRHGMAHGDNTGGALRYARPLGAELAHVHAARLGHLGHMVQLTHAPGVHAASLPPPAAEAPWLQRLAWGLPLQLVPLVGGLPGMVNNMRHAQRGLVWWRYFSQLDRLLHGQLRLVLPPHGQAAQAPFFVAWRDSKVRERLAVRMALCEARFNLSFNAVELVSYAVGLLPLALRALWHGQRASRANGAGTVLPLLLLASGLLHVAQRASWWVAARQARQAVCTAPEFTGPVRQMLLADAQAACRFHALQLGFWSTFSLGLMAATGITASVGLTPLAGGALVLASMVGTKVQRLWAPRHFEVPDSALWQVELGAQQLPTLHRLRTFGPPSRQAAALASLRTQKARLRQLEDQVLGAHTTPWRAWALRTLLSLHAVPGAASLMGALSARWFNGAQDEVSATLLTGYCDVWRLQLALVQREQQADALRLAGQTGATELVRDAWHHASVASAGEARRLQGWLTAAESWVLQPRRHDNALWAALQQTWRVHHVELELPGTAQPQRPEQPQQPAVAAILLAARNQVEDWRRSLLWGAKLGCLSRDAGGRQAYWERPLFSG